MQAVKMYSTGTCPYCIRAKALLKQRGVEAIAAGAGVAHVDLGFDRRDL